MNYFEFYDLPISFVIDEAKLKQIFYKKSRAYHPDFYTLESEAKQAEILALSTLNNEAYKILSKLDTRIKYILTLKGILTSSENPSLPQAFLMEMMDINEALMELEFDFDQETLTKVQENVDTLESTMWTAIEPSLNSYKDEANNETTLIVIKDFYLKKRYLLRIKENLNKFAVHKS